MKKKLISLFVVGILSMGFANSAFAAVNYDDVPVSHPNYTAIMEMQDQGIMTGIGNYFYPDLILTRCELLKVAYISSGMTPAVAPGKVFPDLEMSHWCNDYAYDAKNKSIIQGYGDGNFRPNNPVIIIEAAKIILNAHSVALPAVTSDLYLDVQVGDWWAPYIKYTNDNTLNKVPTTANYGIHNGFGRDKTAQFIYRLLIVLNQPHY